MREVNKALKTVVYICGQAEIGGGERSLLELVTNLDTERYCPVVVLPGEGGLTRALGEHGVKCITDFRVPGLRRGEFLKWPGAVYRLARIVQGEGADIIHGNGTRENIAAGLVGRIVRIPTVWHLRNLVARGMIDMEKPLSFLPRKIVANSRAVARRVKKLRWAKKRLSVVYNGVDLNRFSGNGGNGANGARHELGAGSGEVIVGIVGRIGAGKGHDLFLRAAKLALEREGGNSLRFAVIGDELFTENGRRARVVDLANELGISAHVSFTGYRDDVEKMIEALDILVLASVSEPFGRVLIEAMAAGKPVVATDAGGVKEVVDGGVSALLVKPGDEVLMESAISRLAGDPPLRERMGSLGRERVLRKFSIEEHVWRIQRIYDDILGKNGRGK